MTSLETTETEEAATLDASTLARAHEEGFEWEPPWKDAFLRNLRLMPNVSAAAKMAGINRTTAYLARKSDELFALVWEDAIEVATDSLERFAHTLATTGMEQRETRHTVKRELQTVIREGREVQELVVVEDTMVEVDGRLVDPAMTRWLLQAHRPGKYTPTERRIHTGAGGGPVRLEVLQPPPDPERLRALARIAVELGPDDVEDGEATELTDDQEPSPSTNGDQEAPR